MRCLLIGRDVPAPDRMRLLESLRDAKATVTVLCRRPDASVDALLPDGIEWRLVSSKVRRDAGAVFTRWPRVAHRWNTTSMRLALAEELDREWDAVLLDELGAAWALPQLRVRFARERATLVHLGRAAPRDPGEQAAGHLLARLDARKERALARGVAEAADLVVTTDDGLTATDLLGAIDRLETR